MTPALPTFYISHGGGPWPWMKAELGGAYDGMEASLRRLLDDAGARPRAILMVSAHWEDDAFAVMAAAAPGMFYDYGGFPPHTYHVRYPAPGAPELARHTAELIAAAGLPTRLDPARDFDHGLFAPMAVIRPQADIPTFQVSLRTGLDPAEHLALGRALAPLRAEGVLIVGSGFSFHHLRLFGPAGREPSAQFDAWLARSLLGDDTHARSRALLAWAQAPAAREAHPREEHLLPLMVAVGAAEHEPARRCHHEDDFIGHITVSNFMFGAPARSTD